MRKAPADSRSEESVRTDPQREHLMAVGQAVFVTVLWASSWVIIKFGLQEISPLTFAGLRYSIASIILLLFVALRRDSRRVLRAIDRHQSMRLIAYGFIFVTITQGAQFVGLQLLPAITVSLLLNLSPLIVLVLGILFLKEIPTRRQLVWFALGVFGVVLYFTPFDLEEIQIAGLIVVLVGVFANALSSIMGRAINRERKIPALVVTSLSMTVGASVLLAVGFLVETPAALSPLSWFYVLWLSIVNTAFAFTLWHRTMQALRAVDTSIINSLMLPQIVLLSLWFLGEVPTVLDWIGLLLIGLSVFVVQLIQARRKARMPSGPSAASTLNK
ncbi:hypothetical protein EU538_10945 [Candidatus Thorarchaeota archaeon]|nr:MAG: hypothetical protein EU538_10945 [Candidatus Thorarchaeota archaeon]